VTHEITARSSYSSFDDDAFRYCLRNTFYGKTRCGLVVTPILGAATAVHHDAFSHNQNDGQ
jgi:hypothetical protein